MDDPMGGGRNGAEYNLTGMPPTSLSTNLQRARGGGEYLFAGPSVTTAKEERKRQGWRNRKKWVGQSLYQFAQGLKMGRKTVVEQ